jgi:hypothetical protein
MEDVQILIPAHDGIRPTFDRDLQDLVVFGIAADLDLALGDHFLSSQHQESDERRAEE